MLKIRILSEERCRFAVDSVFQLQVRKGKMDASYDVESTVIQYLLITQHYVVVCA